MKRHLTVSTLALVVALAAPALRADVKTREKTSFKLEGMMGRLLRMAGGGDEITSTVAVRGSRMARIDSNAGQIIDLSEERVYELDVKKKEYRVRTFAEIRAELVKAREQAEKAMASQPQQEQPAQQQPGVELEMDVKVDETGERKNLAGKDTRQVILTLTTRQKGRTLEEGGGFVMTSDMWLGPAEPASQEIAAFTMKYVKAVFGEALGMDPQQAASLAAMFPAFGQLAERMQQESGKLQGTAYMTTTTFDAVKSEEQLKSAQSQSGGGGIGGMLSRRLHRGASEPRSTIMTTTHQLESVSTSVTDADVAIPTGFKEKK
jgi:hypothetical protein